MHNLCPRVRPKVSRNEHCGSRSAILNADNEDSDTLRRHIQRVHGVPEPTLEVKQACTHCRKQKIRCYGGSPCANCQRRGQRCSLAQQKETASPYSFPEETTDTRPAIPQSQTQQPTRSRTESEDRLVGIYFDLFHSYWPFIHRGTFIEHETSLLVQSMVAIALWMSGEEREKSKAIDLHNVLGKAIRQQKVCPADTSDRISINPLTHGA